MEKWPTLVRMCQNHSAGLLEGLTCDAVNPQSVIRKQQEAFSNDRLGINKYRRGYDQEGYISILQPINTVTGTGSFTNPCEPLSVLQS